jgi:hypothetical protein
MKADRFALESALAHQIKCCLNADEIFEASECEEECRFSCDEVKWLGTERKTGGGCAGSILRIETSTM